MTEAEYDLRRFVDEVESLLKDGTYGLSAIKTLIGGLADDPDLMGSVLSRNRAIFDSVHIHIGMVVADKTSLTANETAIVAALRKKYKVYIIDDDDVDAGNFDLEICELVIVSTSVTDMTKINNLTTVAVPVFTRNAEAALTILRIGDDSGGAGVSWGENAAETAINIVDNTHEITTDQSLGSLTVYDPAGRIQWIRATDVVAGAHELAEIDGDNTKSTIVVLPYDVDDVDGNPTPALRVFIGLREFSSFNTAARNLMFNALDWAIHQWLFSVEVAGLGKINTVINMLGRKDFTPAKNLYDYLVTGTTDVIAEQESRSVIERLEWIKNSIRRGTGTILPVNTSLYDYLLTYGDVKVYPWAGTAVLDADPDYTYGAETSEAGTSFVEVDHYDFDELSGDIKSLFVNLVCGVKITGSGSGEIKWQIASGSDASPGAYVDITDAMSFNWDTYGDKGRSGLVHKITDITTTVPFTIRCVVRNVDATSAQAKIKSNSYVRVAYKRT